MSQRNWCKLGLSVFIAFHLLAIIIYPNPQSVLSRYLAPVLNPYGNQLGLNATWQFYSPDPGSIRHFEYKVIQELENQDFKIDTYTWPAPDSSFWQANRARMLTFASRTALSATGLYEVFVPYLCRRHPEASTISVQAVTEANPAIEQAFGYSESFKKMGKRVDMPMDEIECDREVSEVDLGESDEA